MASIGDLFLRLLADDKGFAADVERKASAAGDKAGKSLGQRLKAALSPARIGAALGAAFGTLGVAAAKLGGEVDAAYDTIRAGTGATGEALKGLQGDFRAVAGTVRDDLGLVGEVIADLNTRTGQTGEGLQSLAKNILDLSRITKTDAVANVAAATRLFGDWSIATEDQSTALDKLFRTSQATGIGVTNLMETVVQFGSPMRLLGLSFEESIALLGKWEKEGVNTETAMAGLKFSVKTLANEGIKAADMGEAFRRKLDAIKKSADPVGESIKLFGLRAGPDLAAAILEGRFAIDDLVDMINNSSESIATATAETEDFGDSLAKFFNRAKVEFGDAFSFLGSISLTLGPLLHLLPALTGAFGALAGAIVGKAGPALRGFFEDIALGRRTGLAGIVTRSGAALGAVFAKAFAVAQALGAAVAGMLGKIPGSGAVKAAAVRAGTAVGRIFGLAMAAAVVAIPIVIGAIVLEFNKGEAEKQQEAVSDAVQDIITEGTAKGMAEALAELKRRRGLLSDFWPDLLGTRGALDRQIAELEAALASDRAGSLGPAAAALPVAIADALSDGEPTVTSGALDMLSGVRSTVETVLDEAVQIAGMKGSEIAGAYAQGLTSRRTDIETAIKQMVEAAEEGMTKAEEAARFRKIGSQILDDLVSDIPEQAAWAQVVAAFVDEGLIALGEKPFGFGERLGQGIAAGVDSTSEEAKTAAEAVALDIEGVFRSLPVKAYGWGRSTIMEYVRGLLGLSPLRSPPAPTRTTSSPLRRFAEGGTFGAFEPFIAGERGPELIAPTRPGMVIPDFATFTGQTAGIVNNNVHIDGFVAARDSFEILEQMRRFSELGVFTSPPQPLITGGNR